MPPTIKKRGHPKGHEVTVIGLPAKKTKTATKLLHCLMLVLYEKHLGVSQDKCSTQLCFMLYLSLDIIYTPSYYIFHTTLAAVF